MALAVGSHLGPYEVLSAIGAGGMGEVYKATDTRLERTVAIKALPAHVPSDPDLKQRFEREAKTISSPSLTSARSMISARKATPTSWSWNTWRVRRWPSAKAARRERSLEL